jgi:flagellar hook-associated protein 2
MGSITTGIGLISGIDTAALIDALITLESGPKINLQNRLAVLQARQTALMDINARLLNLKTSSAGLRANSVFQSALATSSDSNVLTAAATGAVQPGTYSFLVKQIVSNLSWATASCPPTPTWAISTPPPVSPAARS